MQSLEAGWQRYRVAVSYIGSSYSGWAVRNRAFLSLLAPSHA